MKFRDLLLERSINPFDSRESTENRLDALEKVLDGFTNNDYAVINYKDDMSCIELHPLKRGYFKAILKDPDGEVLDYDTFDNLIALKKFIRSNGF